MSLAGAKFKSPSSLARLGALQKKEEIWPPSPTCSQRIPKLPGGSALRKGRADRRGLLRRGFSRDSVEKSRGPCCMFSPSNPRTPCSPRSCQPGHLHSWSKNSKDGTAALCCWSASLSLTPSHHHPHPCILRPCRAWSHGQLGGPPHSQSPMYEYCIMRWAINNKRLPNPSALREFCYTLVWRPVILQNSWTHLVIFKGTWRRPRESFCLPQDDTWAR